MRAPTIAFGRRPGRATVRFADATRLEVEGTEVALGRVGTGDLAAPRGFAATLSASDPAWAIDAALSPSSRQRRKPRRPREVFVLAKLDAPTLRAARRLLGLSIGDSAPLFLSADDPAIRAFPGAKLLATCEADRLVLFGLGKQRPQKVPAPTASKDAVAGIVPTPDHSNLSETVADTNPAEDETRPEETGPDPF